MSPLAMPAGIVAVALLAVSVVVAGCGARRDASVAPTSVSETGVALGPAAAVSAPAEVVPIVEAVLGRLGSDRIAAVWVGPAPDDGTAIPGAEWISVTFREGGDVLSTIRASWEAYLVGGAVTRAAHEAGVDEIVGTGTYRLAAGATETFDGGGGVGHLAGGRRLMADELHALIERNAARADGPLFSLSRVETLDPLGGAAVVELTVPDAIAYSNAYQTVLGDLFGSALLANDGAIDWDGYLLIARDATGSLVSIGAYSARNASGTSWWRADTGHGPAGLETG